MRGTLLVADNDASFSDQIVDRFGDSGMSVEVVQQAEPLAEKCKNWSADVALISLALPNLDAMGLFQRIRNCKSRGYLFAYSGPPGGVSAVLAYEAGADDYFSKHIEMTILEAKVRSALRRCRGCESCAAARLEKANCDASRRLQNVLDSNLLTRFEERLLLALGATERSTVPTRDLLQRMWKSGIADPKLLYDHISALRTKLTAFGWTIHNERGQGYRLAKASRYPASGRTDSASRSEFENA